MKIKQKDGVKAYKVLRKLNSQETTIAIAKSIFDNMNALQSLWDFQLQEEKKIIEKHPNFDPTTSTVKMDKESDASKLSEEVQAIEKEFTKIADLDVEVDVKPFTIDTAYTNLTLSGQDIKDLSGFITFE